jgi:MYXO-CTERM domain-containing protein
MFRVITSLAFVGLIPSTAAAFCGFYVSGADAELFNDATLTVMMRDGTRTVLSMRNHYDGPPEDFAMVVPVPTILDEDDVKVIPRDVFDRIDQLSAPRLVEYWEQDPCPAALGDEEPEEERVSPTSLEVQEGADDGDYEAPTGVTVEARFEVGEYDIVILGAEESMGLDRWLRQHGYQIPDGAEGALRPYVQAGMKFFVAKVDVERVVRSEGRAQLSPLRFHYDTDDFVLPVRLGLINSRGVQDLIVVVLARGVRYEAANYDNYAIPTNLDVIESTRDGFGAFYAALFDRMSELHPRSVITEYAWDAGSCDPCPSPPLTENELVTLGGDVIPSYADDVEAGEVPFSFVNDFVLTRLHVRYTSGALSEDLVFRPAPPIRGGGGVPGRAGELDKGVEVSSRNAYQGRYVIRHPWEGPIECEQPQRGIWGGPPGTDYYASLGPIHAATNTAFAPRGAVQLDGYLSEEVPALSDASAARSLPSGPVTLPEVRRSHGGCASCSSTDAGGELAFVSLLAAFAFFQLRRRRRG